MSIKANPKKTINLFMFIPTKSLIKNMELKEFLLTQRKDNNAAVALIENEFE